MIQFVTFSSPSWRSLNPLKGSLNHPQKGHGLNHLVPKNHFNPISSNCPLEIWFSGTGRGAAHSPSSRFSGSMALAWMIKDSQSQGVWDDDGRWFAPSPWKINGRNLQITYLERNMIWTKPPWLWSMFIFQGVVIVVFLVGNCLIHQEIMFFIVFLYWFLLSWSFF